MKQMKRVIVIVLDGVGAGALSDAYQYGDGGANTLQHVLQSQWPELPNLMSLGLGNAAQVREYMDEEPIGCYGRMLEKSKGKDTTTGHWELAGLVLDKPFPLFPHGFPQEIIDKFEETTGFGVIGNKAASGTEIINELGEEHLKTGKLIVYTSADSVFQIAAHEDVVPAHYLWNICRDAREILQGRYGVGRVIARPFAGEPGNFYRTENRKDFSLNPFGDTMLDMLKGDGYDVLAVGKIEDIFNYRGITRSEHAVGNEECMDAAVEFLKKDYWKGLMFVNLVDTDMLYGHRNDPEGFSACLEAFDARLPEVIRLLNEDDLLIITADHGCDPMYPTTDHTREYAPLLVWGLGIAEGVSLGERKSYADVAATVLEALGCKRKTEGESFYQKLKP